MPGSHRFLLLSLVVLFAGASGACSTAPLNGAVRGEPLDVSAVSLPDASNGDAPLAMRAPPGELLLVYFGYTSCPDICPTTMSDLGQAIRRLPVTDAARVAVAMVTLDPDRDTGERLTQYLDHFVERAHALRTTDPDELQRAADAFRVRWEVEPHDSGQPYSISHTAITYAVDQNGKVVVEWPFGTDYELIESDLSVLLARVHA